MDYRLSHQSPEKGPAYENSFKRESSNKYYVWEWEKRVLLDILSKYFMEKPKYLDFACGTGRIIEFLAPYVNSPLGVDVSESMLSVARKKASLANTPLINADITQGNVLKDNHYSLITAFRFFLNAQMSLKQDVISCLAGILDDDGVLVFNIHLNKTSIKALTINTYQFLKKIEIRQTMNRTQVEKLVQSVGLEVVDTYHYGIIPIFDENKPIRFTKYDAVERFCSKIKGISPLAQNVIYVCKKRTHR